MCLTGINRKGLYANLNDLWDGRKYLEVLISENSIWDVIGNKRNLEMNSLEYSLQEGLVFWKLFSVLVISYCGIVFFFWVLDFSSYVEKWNKILYKIMGFFVMRKS